MPILGCTLRAHPLIYDQHMKKLAALAALPLALAACSSGSSDSASPPTSTTSSVAAAPSTTTATAAQASSATSTSATSSSAAASPSQAPSSTSLETAAEATPSDLMSDGSDNLLSEAEKQTARTFARKAIATFPGAFEYMAYNRVYGFGNAPCVYLETMSPAEAKAATRAPNLTDEQQSQFYDLAVSTLCPSKGK